MLKSRHLLGDQGDQGSKGDGTKAKEAVREQAAAVTAAEVAKNGHHHQRDAGAGNGSAGAQQPQAGAAVGQNPGKNSNGAGSGGNNPNRGFLSGGAVGGPTWQEYDRELADLLDEPEERAKLARVLGVDPNDKRWAKPARKATHIIFLDLNQ